MLNKRYSKWLEEYVYDMTDQQEKFLVKEGFVIIKPELVKHDDKVIRDLPHYIDKNKDDCANLVFHRKTGVFYIEVNKRWVYSSEDIDNIKSKLDYLNNIMQSLNKMNN